jgi:penicillin-binding protein 1C
MRVGKSPRARRRIKNATAVALGILLGLILGVWVIPLPPGLLRPITGTPVLVDLHGRTLESVANAEARAQRPIPLAQMGHWLPAVTIALEDHRFASHFGADPQAAFGALWRNTRGGRIVSGGSTITQQLIKVSSHRTGRSWLAKLYENLAALRLERMWTKNRILEQYLNRSHYGNRQLGPAAAARLYFGKTPQNLTLPEAIYLAGLPQAPTRFNPWTHPDAAKAKYQRSVAQLAAAGFLSAEQMERMQQPPAIQIRQSPPRLAPHFVDEIHKIHPHLRGGQIETTLDLDLQCFVEARLRTHLATLAHRGVRQGAVVILDARDGSVRAMAGSVDYAAADGGQINGAMVSRSCGSTLKPFLYLKAIQERRLTAATLLPDTPDAVRAEYIDYDPVNYDKRFWGPVRVREALANSLNVPAVVTLSRVGARRMFLGFDEYGLRFARSFKEYGAGLILGNAEVRLLDLTAAFTVFSGRGLAVEPRFLASAPPRHRFIASPEAVAIVADILSDNHARRKTFSLTSPLAFEDARIPCKTGTSSGFRDAWTVGVTAEHAIGVWVGNFDGRPMDEIASIAGAAPLWREVVDYLLERGDSSVPEPVESARLIRREICSLTGMLPVTASPGIVNEWFLAGTEPVQDASGYLRLVRGEIRLVLPPEYALWCHSPLNYLNAELDAHAPLRIVSPAPDATFVIDPHLPRPQQALRLIASADPAEKLGWLVDGKPVAFSNDGYFWPLVKGRHNVEVTSSNGRVATQFNVE